MLSFKNFITESINLGQPNPNKLSPGLHSWALNFSADHSFGYNPDEEKDANESVEFSLPQINESEENADPHHSSNIIKRGREAEQNRLKANPNVGIRTHVREGFAKAINPNESHEVTKQKAVESTKHFREFMHKEGGYSKDNKINMLGQNGKTSSSSGAGMNTVGLSMSAHTSGSAKHGDGGHFNSCPNSTKECRDSCLSEKAGKNRQYPESAKKAKVLRQRYMLEHPEHAGRVMSKEISENEDFAKNHNTIHDKESGHILGYKSKKTGKISVENKGHTAQSIKEGLDSGKHEERELKSGARLNTTSDVQWHKIMPKHFFDRHHDTQFYDYTKNHGTTKEDLPKNYSVALSHTGNSGNESNTHEAVEHLRHGGVVAMVHHRTKKGERPPTHVIHKGTGEEWEIRNGDNDDNVFDRHEDAAKAHDAEAKHHASLAKTANTKEEKQHHLSQAENHKQIASEFRQKKRGVVSGLELKGVKAEDAGHFANKVHDEVDKHGNKTGRRVIYLGDKDGKTTPQHELRKAAGIVGGTDKRVIKINQA